MIETIKFLTIVATAVFGVLASIIKLRDPQHRITKAGFALLAGITICGFGAAALQLFSDHKADQDTLKLLNQIARSQHPLAPLQVSLSFHPDWSRGVGKTYYSTFENAKRTGVDLDNPRIKMPATINGMKLSLGDATGSSTFTGFIKIKALEDGFCGTDAVVLMYRKPISLQNFKYNVEGSGEDIRIEVNNPCRWSLLMPAPLKEPFYKAGMSLDYAMKRNDLLHLSVQLPDKKIDPTSREWKTTSRITSLQDLQGAQIIIAFDYPFALVSDEDRAAAEVAHSLVLDHLVLRLPGGTSLAFDKDNLRAFKARDGAKAYAIVLPSNLDDLLAKTRFNEFKYY